MKYLIFILSLLSLFGCASNNDFQRLVDYGNFKTSDSLVSSDSEKSLKVSVRASDVSLKDFILSISDEYSVPIVWDSSLDSSLVSGYFVDIELDSLLDTVARRVGTNYINISGVHYLGTLSNTDLATAVYPMPIGNLALVKESISGLVDSNAKISFLAGQVIIRDSVDNIRKYYQSFQTMSLNTRKYLLELWFVNVSSDFMLQLGAELQLQAIDLFSSINVKNLFSLTTSELSLTSNYSTIEQRPVLQVVEGLESSLKIGREVALEQSSVSSEGTFSTTGYETISDGLNLTATVRRLLDDKISLDITLDISLFADVNSAYPVKDSQTLTTTLLLNDGEIFLLGGYGRKSFASSFYLIDLLLSGEDSTILIWGKVRELQ